MVTLSNKDFSRLKEFIYKECGINIIDSKRTMLEARLQKRLKKLDLTLSPNTVITSSPKRGKGRVDGYEDQLPRTRRISSGTAISTTSGIRYCLCSAGREAPLLHGAPAVRAGGALYPGDGVEGVRS